MTQGSNFTFRIRLENSYRRMSSMFSSGKPANKFSCNSYQLYFEWKPEEIQYQIGMQDTDLYIDDADF